MAGAYKGNTYLKKLLESICQRMSKSQGGSTNVCSGPEVRVVSEMVYGQRLLLDGISL